ncbi:MAG: glycosyltransferase family 4 protein [Candidatus Aminicenantes bacterium]|nr:glycosyltransferase family 4 protein [Candidatus Aminicenantes bacterium]
MKKYKIAFIGNYIPRQCGIATFTRDLTESLIKINREKNIKAEAFVVAMNDQNQTYAYPEIVKFTVRQEYQRDYLEAAKFINYSNAEICILQHEFGIFGGENGIYILPLIHELQIPLIVTFHTVLKNPSEKEMMIVREIGKKAEKIVVMSKLAVDFLINIYNLQKQKIKLIEHGVPDFDFIQRKTYKKKLNLENKKSLLTFGLLSRDKGLETVIQALPRVVKKHPEIVYVILGKTHPNVVRSSGEEYRNYLKLLVERNNLRKHVYFYDKYVSNEELFGYLSAIDIYITPYLNEAQITSGTLSYAIGAGAAVVSTPYWHAKELLSDGRGMLFDFKDSDALADLLINLFNNPEKLSRIRKKAYQYGRKTVWPEIGARYLQLVADVLKKGPEVRIKEEPVVNPLILPEFCLDHVQRLTDDTGILQHAKYIIPNFKEGYSLDDNARALLMFLMVFRQRKNKEALKFITTCLSFINLMQNDDGTFKNYLSFNRNFIDQVGSEDSFGRTVWALGYLVKYPPNDLFFEIAEEILIKSFSNLMHLKSIRGMTNSIIGLCHFLKIFPDNKQIKIILKEMTYKIVKSYKNYKTDDWRWFEPILTYDNGILPLSLLHASEEIEDENILKIAYESIEFLEKATLVKGHLSLVGSDNWFKKGGDRSQFAQQPLDTTAMVLMFYQAYLVSRNKTFLKKMLKSYMWFLGENDINKPLYDFKTCGCSDGIESYGTNRNQGAESIIMYMIAHMAVLLAYEQEVDQIK